MSSPQMALRQLDESRLSRFHLKTVITSGMGFFTDAYDLFIIGVVVVLLTPLWHLDTLEISLLSSTALISAALGSLIFGRLADLLGRKAIYGYELLILAIGAIASALAPNIFALLLFRFVLGLGVGGDYPVSATLMSELANRRDRGKLITLVFSAQALGLIIGPLVAILLLLSGINQEITWRIMLGLGAIPALATFPLRRQITESPRFSLAQRNFEEASHALALALHEAKDDKIPPHAAALAHEVTHLASPAISSSRATPSSHHQSHASPWRRFLSEPHLGLWIIGTAGCWFLLDLAYYGTTVTTPTVLKIIAPHATTIASLWNTLLIFVIAALPGYIVAALVVDRLGRKRIQLLGFAMMTLSYGILFFSPWITAQVLPFLFAYGLAYFFTEFGPNVTTFVYPAEIFPVSIRTTAHGISAAVGKIGAFIGAFLFPLLIRNVHLSGAMGLAASAAFIGFLLTFILPEPDKKSLETIEKEGEQLDQELEKTIEKNTSKNE